MKQTLYQIDAFTDRLYAGNPAAVCIMDRWPDDSTMQQIAAENNLAETAFVVRQGDQFHIRWFTPEIEVDLCGHATLASAYVLFRYHLPEQEKLDFYSPRSGKLMVERKKDGLLEMDFPTDALQKIDPMPDIIDAVGKAPDAWWKGKTDLLLVYSRQQEIAALCPDFFKLARIDVRGVIVTAPGDEVDFVSRFFAPQAGIPEDPVTGSAHTSLAPYWSGILGKNKMKAKQLSARGGDIQCEFLGERVKIAGKAVAYMVGEIDL